MFKMLGSKKGISPILATLLLIVIAVAATIITYAWVMTFTTTQTQQAGAVLIVENVRFPNSTTIEITIRNTGTADAKIVEVYLGMSSTNLEKQTSVAYNPTTQIVKAGGETPIVITINKTWASGTRYYFKFVSDAGQILPYNEKAP